MKKYLLIALSLVCLLSACGKRDKFLSISGVNLRDKYNNDMGDMGKPNDLNASAAVRLSAFPVPATEDILNLILSNRSEEPLNSL